MTFSLLEICTAGGDTYAAANESANLRLKYAGYNNMLETRFHSSPFSDPNFKYIKKLGIAML